MKDGFVKVVVATPNVEVANVSFHVEEIKGKMKEAGERKAKIVVFPELCLTGATCGDLFLQQVLLEKAKEGLLEIVAVSKYLEPLFFVGLPLVCRGSVYNVAAAIQKGHVLGLVPKSHLLNFGSHCESRYFQEPTEEILEVEIGEEVVPFGKELLFQSKEWERLKVGVVLGEEIDVPQGEGGILASMGATLLVNLSASHEVEGSSKHRKEGIAFQSQKLSCGYLYANAGEGESTTDLVYAGQSLIVEMGEVLTEGVPFHGKGWIESEIDIDRIQNQRRKKGWKSRKDGKRILFSTKTDVTRLTRSFSKFPCLPKSLDENPWKEIFTIQSKGLQKRLSHTQAKAAVIGLSGGLDSTLAILVTVQAFEDLGWEKKRILGITMPCFGTTDRTYQNACKMAERLGVTLKEIPIQASILQHFRDIGQDVENQDVTYENAQARERTQVLMDVANQTGGLVIGTGDLSEVALGWATYNGDHMSMYGVNASIPKTMVRHLVEYYASHCAKGELEQVLKDVLNTPVSPELLPPKEGEISQKTEDLVGPYELHDFFLYHFVESGFSPSKILRLAKEVFSDTYTESFIQKWEEVFLKRFFSQQFKRSCVPDGPKASRLGLSPRGDWRMPSDGQVKLWLEELG